MHCFAGGKPIWCELRVQALNGRFEFTAAPDLSPQLAEYAEIYGQLRARKAASLK